MNRFILVLEIIMSNLIILVNILIMISAKNHEYVYYALCSSLFLLVTFQLFSKLMNKRFDYNSEYKKYIDKCKLDAVNMLLMIILGSISLVTFLIATSHYSYFLRIEILLTFVPYSIMIYLISEYNDV